MTEPVKKTEGKRKNLFNGTPGPGRPKGMKNKRTTAIENAVAAAGITPLEYLLSVMRTSPDSKMRLTAAQAAAPYVHAKLASIEYTGKDGGPIEVTQITRRIVRS